MTPEQRLDRLERICRLMAQAGPPGRRQRRQQNEKINIILDARERIREAQIKFSEAQEKNDEIFAKLAESHAQTGRKLDALIDIIRKDRNGGSR
jgi:hypothetical protein